jgi:importin subunit alpha-2
MVSGTLFNLCVNGGRTLTVPTVRELLPALVHFLNNNDGEILYDACAALYNLVGRTNEVDQEVVDEGVVPRLVAVLHREEQSVNFYTLLKTIGMIVKGRTDSVLAADSAYPLLAKFLAHSEFYMVEKAAAIVSSIAAVNAVEVQDLITNNVTRPLVDVSKGDLKCQKEAAWDITKITLGN